MPGRLTQRTAIVTGASSGLGRAIALRYAAEGARVVCADLVPSARDIIAAESQPTHELIRQRHGDDAATFVVCDVRSEEAVAATVTAAVEWGGRLDVMVNNAGISAEVESGYVATRAHETPTAVWDRTFSINTRGVFLGCKYALAQFLAQTPRAPNERGDATRGWIVNTASMLGLVVTPGAPSYVSSKHAVIGLTKQVAVDYAKDRIHCNCLCPGFINTALTKPGPLATAENEAMIASMHPWGSLGTPDDVARAAVFLASDDASYITGQPLLIDGGYVAQ